MMFEHKEAFCLMQYQDEVTGEIEVIWNSRDAVTPFGLTSRQGNQCTHVNWPQDICAPLFIPNVGARVFIDLTPELALEMRTAFVEENWEKEICGVKMKNSGHWATKEEAIKDLAWNDVADGQPPTCVVVTEELQKEFRQAQQDRWSLAGVMEHSKASIPNGGRFA